MSPHRMAQTTRTAAVNTKNPKMTAADHPQAMLTASQRPSTTVTGIARNRATLVIVPLEPLLAVSVRACSRAAALVDGHPDGAVSDGNAYWAMAQLHCPDIVGVGIDP